MKNKNLMMGMTLALVSFVLSGCQGDERIKEVSAKETEAQIEVENKNAAIMEEDLQERQRFYQGVAGIYEGSATSQTGVTYNIRVQLVPSLPAFTPTRIRMREEVASDLNNLFFHAQVLLWSPNNTIGAIGCLATEIRPDLGAGEITIASPDCPNLYTIRIHDREIVNGQTQGITRRSSAMLSRAIRDGQQNLVKAIYGSIQPKSTSETLAFSAERLADQE